MSGTDDDDAWSGERVHRWLRQAEALERQLAPVSTLLFAAAAIRAGESVLDVGCGAGPTTREAAALVGPSGRVTGLDISPEMLEAAAAASADAPASLDWVRADAVSWAPPANAYDTVLSRFGVMFFADPVAALRNLASATRPGGRFAAAVWGPRPASALFELPYRIALRRRADVVDPLPPDAGPFSWHDARSVIERLSGAGWRDVDVAPNVVHLAFAGGADPGAAAEAALDFGPTRLVMAGAEAGVVAQVRTELAAAFADHVDAAGHVVLDAQIRIVTASR